MSDICGRQPFRQRRIAGAVGHHLLDDADRARRTRGQWSGRDGIHAHAPLSARFERQQARVRFQRRLRAGHAATVTRNRALAGHVGQRVERAARPHQRPETLHHADHGVGAGADCGQVAMPRHLQQRLLHLGTVRERMHHDVQRLGPEVGGHALHQAIDAEVAQLLVALVFTHIIGRLVQRVVHRVQRVDALERQQRAIGHLPRIVDLAALDQVEEDVERGGPGGHAHRCSSGGQCLCDGPAETVVVSDARHQRALACEIDGQHSATYTVMARSVTTPRGEAGRGRHPRSAGPVPTRRRWPTRRVHPVRAVLRTVAPRTPPHRPVADAR